MLNICITFDHEIYFGENYFSEEEILFKPTYRLMEVLNKNGIGGTFFTDVCSVFKHQSLGLNGYPEQMATQLKTLIANKQDVQLHIHSHWYKSEYLDGKWKFDDKSYRIHSFGFNGDKPNVLSGNKIIKDGKAYLESVLQPVDRSYRCIAFRAGGFCLQPENDLLRVLRENGIMIDSSIAKNLHTDNIVHYYSFLNMPEALNWWMSPKTGIKIAADVNIEENIYEVPIGTLKKKTVKWFLSKSNVPLNQPIKRGTYISMVQPKIGRFQRVRKRLQGIWSTPITLSLDSYREDVLIGIIKEYLKDYDCKKNEYYVSVICHPKIMGDDHIQNLDSFIKKAKKNIPLVRFVTMRDIYEKIRK